MVFSNILFSFVRLAKVANWEPSTLHYDSLAEPDLHYEQSIFMVRKCTHCMITFVVTALYGF